MGTRQRWVWILFVLIVCFLANGCAEFLEDYRYNPAGPLYQSSGSSY